ncbi:MAG: cation diffusion facilitator family transporter [Chromatiales bacterium]|nr:cation diffusion facilitator family transporter [Chromatiales bacterium]
MPEASHDMPRYRAMRRVTIVGAVINLFLSVTQIATGVLLHSQALLADGVHTLSDLVSDGVVLFASGQANRHADAEHPYGHGRIETLATVFVGLMLMGVAAGIGWDAGHRLFEPEDLLVPAPWAMFFASLAIFSKEALYHYTIRVANRIRSNLLRANAWHHRSDVASSLVVVVGIGGTLAGLPYLDAIAAVIVAGMILLMGWRLVRQSVNELIDTGLEPERVASIRDAILSVDGVKSLHMLRTRRMGGSALADVHILVSPRISVSEGHHISDTVRRHLVDSFDELTDVTVHIDPEDDEKVPPSSHLPGRAELLDKLHASWSGVEAADAVDRIGIHYLNGKAHIEIHLPLARLADLEQARHTAERLRAASHRVPEVGEVSVHFD